MEKNKLVCTYCGTEVSYDGEHFKDSQSIMKSTWCRFQYAKDWMKKTPWFCCNDHLVEWIVLTDGKYNHD